MSEHFYDNDFEKFLQQQVKQHRMYPSDAVWKGIYKQMHGNKRWPGLYFVAIIMIAALTVCTVFMDSSPMIYPQQKIAKASTPIYDQLDPEKITHQTLKRISNSVESLQPSGFDPVISLQKENTVAGNKQEAISTGNAIEDIGIIELKALPQYNTNIVSSTISQSNALTENKAAVAVKNETKQSLEKPLVKEEGISLALNSNVKKNKRISSKINRWQYQVYIAPSMNYRQIVDEKPKADQFGGPVVTNYGVNANQVIRYKPGMGIEFGFGVLYSITNRLRLKAGLQYNVRQYNIEAYEGPYQLSKIALVRGSSIDSITTIAKYRSIGAANEALLLNKYHQISLPVGVEYAVVNGKKMALNIAGSLQPTYTFSQSSYLLTSDYKNYADGTSMIRRWNLNSSLEATLSYKIGDFQWKFGPQLRYQHLPTYTSAYPIKEYLIDYGFRIGFTKIIK